MFDNLEVAQKLIIPLLEDGFCEKMSFFKDGYFMFQTKDLDDLMKTFFIEENGDFLFEQEYREYIPPPKDSDSKFNFGQWKELKPSEKLPDLRRCYIEFYDLFCTENERIFITFVAHVKDGKLQEDIKLLSIERNSLKEGNERTKHFQEKWKLVRSTWQWKVSEFMRDFPWKIKRFFLPVTHSVCTFYNDLAKKLRFEAQKKFLDEKDINNW
jgi:hypothetical protein